MCPMRRSSISNFIEWKVRVSPCPTFSSTLLQSISHYWPLQTHKALQLPNLCAGRSLHRSLSFYLTNSCLRLSGCHLHWSLTCLQAGEGIPSPPLSQPRHSTPSSPHPPHLHRASIVSSSLYLAGSSIVALTHFGDLSQQRLRVWGKCFKAVWHCIKSNEKLPILLT